MSFHGMGRVYTTSNFYESRVKINGVICMLKVISHICMLTSFFFIYIRRKLPTWLYCMYRNLNEKNYMAKKLMKT